MRLPIYALLYDHVIQQWGWLYLLTGDMRSNVIIGSEMLFLYNNVIDIYSKNE